MFNKELVNRVRKLVKEGKVIIGDDGQEDIIKHDFPEELVSKTAFLKGIIVEDKELYQENPDLKHKGKNYYCIYKYTVKLILSRTILNSFIITDNVIIFHTSPLNYGSREERFYRKNIKKFKELFLQE